MRERGVRPEKTDANRACLDQGVMDLVLLVAVVADVKRTDIAEDRGPGAPETWQTLATAPAFVTKRLPRIKVVDVS